MPLYYHGSVALGLAAKWIRAKTMSLSLHSMEMRIMMQAVVANSHFVSYREEIKEEGQNAEKQELESEKRRAVAVPSPTITALPRTDTTDDAEEEKGTRYMDVDADAKQALEDVAQDGNDTKRKVEGVANWDMDTEMMEDKETRQRQIQQENKVTRVWTVVYMAVSSTGIEERSDSLQRRHPHRAGRHRRHRRQNHRNNDGTTMIHDV